MVVKLQIPWGRIIRDLKVPFIVVVLYMTSISLLDRYLPLDVIHVPLGIITVPGTVIALLLAFRTNSAYDRWWEARIIWGAIVNDSRTLIRQLMTFLPFEGSKSPEFQLIYNMGLRHIAWVYSLTRHLRKQDVFQDMEGLIENDEIQEMHGKMNIPNALLYNQAEKLKLAYKNNWLDAYQFAALDNTISRHTDALGKCERIKNTVFPSGYSLLIDVLIYLWVLFLPFGLVDMVGYILIPTGVSIAISFLVIDRIAVYMQDPFENLPSDTPMTTLARTIEINIKQELGIKEIPDPVQDASDVLM